MTVKFYTVEETKDEEMKFALIISKYKDQWVLCKHKQRDTLEIPGGTREENELIDATAHRELYEETGAKEYELTKLFVFEANGSFATVYFAKIHSFDKLPESEMESMILLDNLEDVSWTYPNIQPKLIDYYLHTIL